MNLPLLKSKNPKIAAIIPTLNEEEYIGALVDSLQENTYKNKEIIVVDDGSSDKTVEIAKAKGAKVAINKPARRGPAFGWNRCVKNSDADIVCLFDADGKIGDKRFLEKMVEAFKQPGVAAAYPKYETKPDTFLEAIVTQEKGVCFEPRVIRRDVFLKVGGFPEIGLGEDRIYAENVAEFIRKNNLKENVSPETYIEGHGVHTLNALYKQAKWYGRTGPMFLKQGKGSFFKKFFATYGRMVYFLSFLATLLLPLSIFFAAPAALFAAMFFGYIAANRKKPVHMLKVFTNILFGLGLLHGLLIYFLGIHKSGGA